MDPATFVAAPRRSDSRRVSRRNTAAVRKNAVAGGGVAGSIKTQLLAEFRAQEEDLAARVVQRAARAHLARRNVVQRLMETFERHYDPIAKKYLYVNRITNEASWEKPPILRFFLRAGQDVGVAKVDLKPADAAKRIQRLARAFLAMQHVRGVIRECYMKLFNTETMTFYYLNTQTGAISDERPSFLRRDEDDLEVEAYHFRRAVCKITTPANLYGSGVLGAFCGMLCLLADGTTMPDEENARNAHVVCNFASDCVAFNVMLIPERFFAVLRLSDGACFTLCAIEEVEFTARAGSNICALKFELNDRKLGCADGSMRVRDSIEIVGYPHGKPQVVHPRVLAKMTPHSISPLTLQYDRVVETGGAGSAVFTRGGKLLGIQHFTSLTQPPQECYYIRPILHAALNIVTPPQPYLLASSIGSTDIRVNWQIPRHYHPLRGLSVAFEVEICQHESLQEQVHDDFRQVYTGAAKSKYVGALSPNTMYSVRCRAKNRLTKSAWSVPARFVTASPPSLAWRMRYCANIADAIKRLREAPLDPQTLQKCLQWLLGHLQGAEFPQCQAYELELATIGGLDLLMAALGWFPERHDLTLLVLRLLNVLAELRQRTQVFLSSLEHVRPIVQLVRDQMKIDSRNDTDKAPDSVSLILPDRHSIEILLAGISLLAWILDSNASGKQVFEAADGLELVVSCLQVAVSGHHSAIASECCFLLGRYSFNQTQTANWHLVDAGGLPILRDLLQDEQVEANAAYWALLTLGNLASSCNAAAKQELATHIDALHLVTTIGQVKMQYLMRLHDLEIDLQAAEAEHQHLQATLMDEGMRNELDACAHRVETIQQAIATQREHAVAQAADTAFQYLLTEQQRRVQCAAQRIMRRLLSRQLASAMSRWAERTLFIRQCTIFRSFLTAVTQRQLSAAFRRWEQTVREAKRHKSLLQTIGSGLAIDLTRKKREQYRMLVLQK